MNVATLVIYACLTGTTVCGQQTVGDMPLVACLRDAPGIAREWFAGNAAWEPDRQRPRSWACRIQIGEQRPA